MIKLFCIQLILTCRNHKADCADSLSATVQAISWRDMRISMHTSMHWHLHGRKDEVWCISRQRCRSQHPRSCSQASPGGCLPPSGSLSEVKGCHTWKALILSTYHCCSRGELGRSCVVLRHSRGPERGSLLHSSAQQKDLVDCQGCLNWQSHFLMKLRISSKIFKFNLLLFL